MSNSFKASYKYALSRLMAAVPVTAISIGLSLVLNLLINQIYDPEELQMSISGLDLLAAVISCCCCADCCGDLLNTGCAGGVSRRTAVMSLVPAAVTVSAAEAVIVTVVTAVLNIFFPGTGGEFFLEMLYLPVTFSPSSPVFFCLDKILFFLLITMSISAFSMAGAAAAAICYKLNRIAKTVTATATLILLIGVTPVLVLNESIYNIFIKIGTGILTVMGAGRTSNYVSQTGHLIMGIFFHICLSAALGFVCWLFARRASTKPMAVRGD